MVQSDLKKLHVNVVLSADDGVTATDTVAVDQELSPSPFGSRTPG